VAARPSMRGICKRARLLVCHHARGIT
jgi:hypothetical protein